MGYIPNKEENLMALVLWGKMTNWGKNFMKSRQTGHDGNINRGQNGLEAFKDA